MTSYLNTINSEGTTLNLNDTAGYGVVVGNSFTSILGSRTLGATTIGAITGTTASFSSTVTSTGLLTASNGLTSTAGTTTLGTTTIGAITGTSASFSTTLGVTGLATFGAGGLTSTAGTTTLGSTTIGAISGTSASFSSTLNTTGLATFGAGGLTSTAGTTTLGATTIGAITGTSASFSTTLNTTGLATFGAGGLTSTAGTTTLGATTIGAITGTSASFSTTLNTTGLATFGAGGLTSTAGTTTLGTTTIGAITGTSASFSTTVTSSGLLTASNGLTSTGGTTTLGATTIGAITGTSASFSSSLTASNGFTSTGGTTTLGATTIGEITGTSASFSTTLGVTGLATFGAGGLTSTAGTTTLGATTIGVISGTSASFSTTLGVTGLATFGAGGLTSTAGTTTLGATTIGAISGTTASFSSTVTTTGLLTASNGLTSTAGTTTLGATTIGAISGTSASFSSSVTSSGLLTASNGLTSTGGTTTLGATTIGAITGTSASFTNQITSTLSSGTPPFVVASSTNVLNLNASSLSGATFQSPGSIGSNTPGSGVFTTLTANTSLTSTSGTTSLGTTTLSGELAMGNNKITGLATPTDTNDATTKGYVDSVSAGTSAKTSVIVATTSPGTLATSFENGDTIDGVTLVTGYRILIKDQTNQVENGVYIVNVSGSPSRAPDFGVGYTAAGTFVFIQEGTVNDNAGFICNSSSGSDIVGTDNITFSQFTGAAQVIAGTGLTKSGNTLSVNASQTQITSVGTLSALSVSGAISGSSQTLSSTLGVTGLSSLRDLDLLGSSSGIVSVRTQANSGTYNYNIPTSSGSSGEILTSGGGVSSPMTWTPVTGTGNVVLANSPTLGAISVGAITGTSASFSTTLGVTGLATFGAGGLTSTAGTTTLGATTIGAISGTSASFSTTLNTTGLATFGAGGLTSTAGTTTLGATTIGAITGTSASFSSSLTASNGFTSTAGTTTLGATTIGAISGTSASFSTTLGVTGLATFGAGGLTSTAGTTTLGATTIGAISGTSASFSTTLGVTGLATFGAGGLTSTSGTTTLGATTIGTITGTSSTFSNSTSSTSKTTGAVTVVGGIATEENLNVGGYIGITGSTSGTISIKAQATTATYNYNLPTTAGTAGQILTSAGGAGAPMTWEDPTSGTISSIALAVPSFLSITGSPLTTSGTLTIGLSGTALSVANGGTGATTFTSNSVLLGNGTSAIQSGSNITYSTDTLTLPKIISNDTTATTSNSTGSILLSGGLAINNATDAVSSTNGGSITTAGGLAVAKKLFVGTSADITSTVSTSGILARGATSGTVSILPQANAGTFNFNLPITAGVSGQVLTSTGGGSSAMSWTTPALNSAPQTFNTTGLQTQPTPVNVTGLSYTSGSFDISMTVEVVATTSLTQIFKLTGILSPSSGWSITPISVSGDESLVDFTISAGGNIQYTSGTYAGFTSLTFTWAQFSTTQGIGYLALAGSGSGVVTITPQPAAGTYNYNLPTTAGTTGQVLTSAGGGSSPMTWGKPWAITTSFSAVNNQVSAANVTGLLYSAGCFETNILVVLVATTNLNEFFKVAGVKKGDNTYDMAIISQAGDTSGVTFSINSSGQVQYTSANSAGFVSLTFKWMEIGENFS